MARTLAAQTGVTLPDQPLDALPGFAELVRSWAATAAQNGMEIVSCAEELDLPAAACCPANAFMMVLLACCRAAPRSQERPRPALCCGLRRRGRDIRVTISCTFGCQYCYATRALLCPAAAFWVRQAR